VWSDTGENREMQQEEWNLGDPTLRERVDILVTKNGRRVA